MALFQIEGLGLRVSKLNIKAAIKILCIHAKGQASYGSSSLLTPAPSTAPRPGAGSSDVLNG